MERNNLEAHLSSVAATAYPSNMSATETITPCATEVDTPPATPSSANMFSAISASDEYHTEEEEEEEEDEEEEDDEEDTDTESEGAENPLRSPEVSHLLKRNLPVTPVSVHVSFLAY